MSDAIKEIDVLWITAGLGCDGDTVAITNATQPSLEDVIQGIIPGIPKVRFHNPVLAYENAGEFMQFFHDAADGKLDPFILHLDRPPCAQGLGGGDRRDLRGVRGHSRHGRQPDRRHGPG